MLGAGVCFSAAMTAFRYTSGLRGSGNMHSEVDGDEEVERREELKKLRRRPLSETLEQLGEGRGAFMALLLTAQFTDSYRHLRSWIRGEEKTATAGEVWHRC